MTFSEKKILSQLKSGLTREQAEKLYAQGKEAVVFALLAIASKEKKEDAKEEHLSDSTPSGMTPTYKKPPGKKRKKKPGRNKGHAGSRRKKPKIINKKIEHRLSHCPDCGGELQKGHNSRKRYTEDIAPVLEPVNTQHTIFRDWCPKCQKSFEPVVTDALPKSQIGLRLAATTMWLHYGVGNTISQIMDVLKYQFNFTLSGGGLTQMWVRMGKIVLPWYEQLHKEVQEGVTLHADETGWRVWGSTHWLWCLSNKNTTYYFIDKSRGSPALKKFFTEAFDGVLITDFWSAYNSVRATSRQMCLVHLLRELKNTTKYKKPKDDWPEFEKKVRRLMKDAIRLSYQKSSYTDEVFTRRKERLEKRLQEINDHDWKDSHCKRLVKRLKRHNEHVFTFVANPRVPFDNNHAEREIRHAVIKRKNSFGNRSDDGANTQAIAMTIFRTLKRRGLHPINVVVDAIKNMMLKGELPPFPQENEI